MGVELKDWLDYVRNHPLKFRFDGLHSRGRRSESDFHRTVGEAAIADEQFMSEFMNDEYEGIKEEFDKAVADRQDHDEMLSRFAEFCEHKVSAATWHKRGFKCYRNWSKAPLEEILKIVDEFEDEGDFAYQYIRDWCMSPDEHYWEQIKQDETLIEKHPPVAAWCNAGDYEIPVEEIFFTCPSCSEPQTEEGLNEMYTKQNGYPYFYCGGCGSEMSVGKHEHILDFFNAMETVPYPFNPEKRAHWQKLMTDRKAWGENKLELVVHDRIRLKKPEEREGHFGASGEKWTLWLNEPGEIVEISRVDETGVMVFSPSDVDHEYFVRFDHIYGKMEKEVLT